ncbi:hypothetical protein SARC_06196 [Sphaeroforma arctica JP610]|uniref:RRM domain-containing protein n=1 Tax=Sphaeroforma arctica JP610 TaxID=667725 RepID=A0A0L0FXC7_9EUKA|nr:hypothetical protein SARC_06196 [Sphaeroforma arctica JP610]KNC81487.1 hypothetical protein SARC_06196 [Sphaeroforma arctica JP610]|eukprot:XP_014155389.1 hypothetical protein SARC_06196 [Sphaeroforma arctica JP610]
MGECELLEFKVPHERDRIIVARHDNGFTDITDSQLKDFFERFGLVFEAQIAGGGGYHRQDQYAYIKYYSKESARNAIAYCNSGAMLFRGRPISCTLLRKDRVENGYMTVHACTELANKTLGFNNWCTIINYVKRVDPCETSDSTTDVSDNTTTMSEETVEACVDIRITTWRVQLSRGIARSHSSDVENQNVPDGVPRAKRMHTSAIREAKLAAFRNILIALFSSGKLEVILKNEVTKAHTPDESFKHKPVSITPTHTSAEALTSTLDDDYPADFWDDVDRIEQHDTSISHLLSGDEWDECDPTIDDWDPGVAPTDTGSAVHDTTSSVRDRVAIDTPVDASALAYMDDDPFWDDLGCDDYACAQKTGFMSDAGADIPTDDAAMSGADALAEEGSNVLLDDEDGFAEALEYELLEGVDFDDY